MKAVEFIRKFGWGSVVELVNNTKPNEIVVWLGTGSNDFCKANDLKKFTDAYELVQKFGGYEAVLGMINNPICFGDSNFEIEEKLNEAITLVEEVGECNE